MSEFNTEEMLKKFNELKKKGGPITLEDVAGKELIEQAVEHHKSLVNDNGGELDKADRELLEEYHTKATNSHANVSSIGEFTNSEGDKCTGFEVDEHLIFFDIQSNCMCIDEDNRIHEIALNEI